MRMSIGSFGATAMTRREAGGAAGRNHSQRRKTTGPGVRRIEHTYVGAWMRVGVPLLVSSAQSLSLYFPCVVCLDPVCVLAFNLQQHCGFVQYRNNTPPAVSCSFRFGNNHRLLLYLPAVSSRVFRWGSDRIPALSHTRRWRSQLSLMVETNLDVTLLTVRTPTTNGVAWRDPEELDTTELQQLQRRSFTRVPKSDREVYEARTEAAEANTERRQAVSHSEWILKIFCG
ncbi:unnamed protein product, partial [Ectocarpus sp. 12 AP-2014]